MDTTWKNGPVAGAIWALLRIYLGYQWLHAGFGKITDGFDASGFIQGAIGKATGENPAVQGWYANFLENVALPNAKLFSFLVMYGELLIGLGLILGLLTIPALLAGAFMNLNFLLAGTVSTNPILYTLAIILLFAGAGAYYYGLDRWVMPKLFKKSARRNIQTSSIPR